jgi:alpha-glucosidase
VSPLNSDPHWWRQAAVYQVYPRSFADSNGDGIGDLAGVTSRVPYLAALSVDAVWLSPFYPSALADGGYDVDDYRAVDPKLGTLADFDEMVAALHAAGIRVIIDIVPNHSSDRHVWFQEALTAPKGSPARDRYIFRDGRGPDGSLPPTEWKAMFGGSAWKQVADGQWYLHLFAPEQPDFNWKNGEVRDDFLKTLRFWSDRGVDGYRIDVANALAKDLPDPVPAGITGEMTKSPLLWDRDEVHDIYREWRKVFDEYDPPRTAVAEAWVESAERRARYASPEGLGQAFNFDLLRADFDAAEFREIIAANLIQAATAGTSSTWVFSNHDVVRHASRYGLPLGADENAWLLSNGTAPPLDRELGLRRARAATLLMLALPGSAYLYQGEELGLHEVADLPADALQDPTFARSEGEEKGRDGCRVPLPWTTDGPSYGFGAGSAHLPQPAWFAGVSAQAEDGVPESTLSLYREALRLRRSLAGAEQLEWVDEAGSVLHFVRPSGWHSVTNFGPEPVDLPTGEVVVTSGPLADGKLPSATTAWIVAQ